MSFTVPCSGLFDVHILLDLRYFLAFEGRFEKLEYLNNA